MFCPRSNIYAFRLNAVHWQQNWKLERNQTFLFFATSLKLLSAVIKTEQSSFFSCLLETQKFFFLIFFQLIILTLYWNIKRDRRTSSGSKPRSSIQMWTTCHAFDLCRKIINLKNIFNATLNNYTIMGDAKCNFISSFSSKCVIRERRSRLLYLVSYYSGKYYFVRSSIKFNTSI